jgi:WD40 repeat protein
VKRSRALLVAVLLVGSAVAAVSAWLLWRNPQLPADDVLPVPSQLDSIVGLTQAANGKRLAAVCRDGTIIIWSLPGCDYIGTWKESDVGLHIPIAFSPSGELLAAQRDEVFIKVWDVAEQKIVAKLQHGGYPHSVCFSPDGKQVMTTGSAFDGAVRIWDIQSGRGTIIYEDETKVSRESPVFSKLTSARFTADGMKAIVLANDKVREIDLASLTVDKTFQPLPGSIVHEVLPFPDNERMAIMTERCVFVYNRKTEGMEFALTGISTISAPCVAYFEARNWLIIGTSPSWGGPVLIQVADLRSRQVIRQFKFGNSKISGVEVSKDGSLLVSSGVSVRRWLARTWQKGLD